MTDAYKTEQTAMSNLIEVILQLPEKNQVKVLWTHCGVLDVLIHGGRHGLTSHL